MCVCVPVSSQTCLPRVRCCLRYLNAQSPQLASVQHNRSAEHRRCAEEGRGHDRSNDRTERERYSSPSPGKGKMLRFHYQCSTERHASITNTPLPLHLPSFRLVSFIHDHNISEIDWRQKKSAPTPLLKRFLKVSCVSSPRHHELIHRFAGNSID